jgi:hypothetical protein
VPNVLTTDKHWQAHLGSLQLSPARYEQRRDAIENFLKTYAIIDPPLGQSADQSRLDEIHKQVLRLLEEGDHIAARIRSSKT